MKRLLLFLLVLTAVESQAQDPLINKFVKPNNTYGTILNRLYTPYALTPALDTLDEAPQGSIAFKNHTMYYKDTVWKIWTGGGGSSDGNNYPASLSFSNNSLTLTRNGLGSISADWDSTLYHSFPFYNTQYAFKSHAHVASDISDITTYVRNLFTQGTGISYNPLTGVIAWDGSGAGITSFNGLTGGTQTLAFDSTYNGAAGWSSVGTAHTLRLPARIFLFDSTKFHSEDYFNTKYQPIGSYVPTSRTITVNGTTLDLSANRSWTIASGGTFNTRYSITKGTGDSAQLVGDTSLAAPNATPLAYQIINGVRKFAPSKADTADIFGIDSSTTFSNVTELRSTQLYNKGARYARTMGYSIRNDGGGSYYVWNQSSTATDDGKFVFKPNSISSGSPGRWEWLSRGVVRAAEAGVKSDGTDQLSTLSSLFSLSTVKGVLFDNGDVTFSGKLTIPSGKKLIFENDSKLKGDGGANDTLSGGLIVCDIMKQALDTSLTPLNLENEMLSVRWIGAEGKRSLYDNWRIFNKAQKALKQFTNLSSYYNFSGRIYVPRDDSSYYFSRPLVISTTCEFYGDGEIQTMLEFPADSAGITLAYADGVTRAGLMQYVHDFTIRGNGTNYVPGANGLTVNNLSRVEYVTVDYFGGDGFLYYGNVPNTNANNSHNRLCTAQNNRGNGFVAKGGDGNVIVFDHINAGANWQYGAVDSSFLGCTWIQPHAEDNGFTSPYSRARIVDPVTGNTIQSYWAKRTPPVGMKPGVTSGWQNYWHPVTDTVTWSYGWFPVWDTTVQYLGNGAYASTDNNSRSAWFSPYVEGNQGGVLFSGTSTLVYGGLLACDDYTASDPDGSKYQYIKASGSTRPGILIPNFRFIANNGLNTGGNKTYGGIEIRANDVASYGFNMGGVSGALNNEHIFGGTATADIGLSFSSLSSTAGYGRLSALANYSPIFHNGFHIANANAPETYTMQIRAASNLTAMGSNNANGDFTFNNNAAGIPGLLGWQNIAQGAGVWDSTYVNGFVPRYTTSTRPTTTVPRIIWNTDSSKLQVYTPGTGWVNLGSGSPVVSGGSSSSKDTLAISDAYPPNDSTTKWIDSTSKRFCYIYKDSVYVSAIVNTYSASRPDADATTYINAVQATGVTLTDPQKTAIYNYVKGLKTDGLWNLIYDQGIPVWGTAASSAVMLKGTHTTTWVNSPTFGSTGVTGNGTSSYGNLNFSPNTAYTSQDDAHLAVYIQNNVTDVNQADIGTVSTSPTRAIRINSKASGATQHYLNSSSSGAGTVSTSAGFTLINRTSSSNIATYKNGTFIVNDAISSTGLATNNIFIMASNQDGSAGVYSTRTLSLWSIGKTLTGTQITNLSSRVNALMTSLGINVY